MKKKRTFFAVILSCLLTVCLVGTSTVMAESLLPRKAARYVSTSNSGLNVRNGPGLSYNVIATLANGTKLKDYSLVSKQADGYFWVSMTADDIYGNEVWGYVAEEYLSYSRPYSILYKIGMPNVG